MGAAKISGSGPLRSHKDFTAVDGGNIGKSPSTLAPNATTAAKVHSASPAGEPNPGVQKINTGPNLAEISKLNISLHDLYEEFKKSSLADDIRDRWLRRIGWGMYLKRRVADKEATDAVVRYAKEMHEILVDQLIRFRAERADIEKVAKREFIEKAKENVIIRNEERELQFTNQLENKREGIKLFKELFAQNKEARSETFKKWLEGHRDLKKEFFADFNWEKTVRQDLLADADLQAALRRAKTAELVAAFVKASQELPRPSSAGSSSEDGVAGVPKISLTKV